MTAPYDPSHAAEAQRDSLAMTTAEIVGALRGTIGAVLVAYIAGISNTSDLTTWVTEAAVPPAVTEQRLRAAYAAAMMLGSSYDPATVSSWFQGMNPELDDVAPARLLRDEPDIASAREKVFAAARSFLIYG